MKKLLLLITISAAAFALYAQSETQIQKSVASRFEKHYNAGAYDSIFNMFNADMKQALPWDKTKGFFDRLNSSSGKIVSREFSRIENGGAASYKTKFERALYSVLFYVTSDGKLAGLFVKPFADSSLPKIDRNITKLKLPFKGEWTVFWGGDTKEQNYHVDYPSQKNAFDIVIRDTNGRSFKTNGQTNEDYYAFGAELIAPCDGEVVLVDEGVKDNKPGELNPVYVPGNTVIIKTINNEFLFFAHFKQHTIKVKQGDMVKQGQLLGLCGNSGNSSEPHVHFHIQNVENMNIATGVKCYFESILVNGQRKNDYSPVQHEKIRNE